MHTLCAADKPDRSEAIAILIQRRMRSRDQCRVIGETEIVIGAKVDDFESAGDADIGLLW